MTSKICERANLHGYDIEVTDESGEVEAFVTRGRYGANLATLEETGVLLNAHGQDHQVQAWVIGDLANWAYQNGL